MPLNLADVTVNNFRMIQLNSLEIMKKLFSYPFSFKFIYENIAQINRCGNFSIHWIHYWLWRSFHSFIIIFCAKLINFLLIIFIDSFDVLGISKRILACPTFYELWFFLVQLRAKFGFYAWYEFVLFTFLQKKNPLKC